MRHLAGDLADAGQALLGAQTAEGFVAALCGFLGIAQMLVDTTAQAADGGGELGYLGGQAGGHRDGRAFRIGLFDQGRDRRHQAIKQHAAQGPESHGGEQRQPQRHGPRQVPGGAAGRTWIVLGQHLADDSIGCA
ncbi:MAG: hypothetical protein COW48_03480 [Hydrogenophilales bacterium CG17_big_fil_post_rev_8_21_14_2_50_63_12]|nr:MAG: hypothetical protein COW48_03480 [Hydrogenophilales bacterium CG17_big_fil_post_rev_8_21_14_2_50_63_12]PIX97241.1 MAG: hypothetical protein COZ24_06390 [Hydrogenophilales bacterium CG_4_10_14_3_um_filter_63_21]